MFYLNSHHLFDALQKDRDGNPIDHADCIAGFLRFTNNPSQYEDRLSLLTEEIISLPGHGFENDIRQYLLSNQIRAIILAENIMNEPGKYVSNAYHVVMVKDILCARSLIEVVAAMNLSFEDFLKSLSDKESYKNWVRRYIYGTKLTKGAKGNKSEKDDLILEGFSGLDGPVQIMKSVKKLADKHPFSGIFYNIFSEFCHPNGMALHIAHSADPLVFYGYNVGYSLSMTLTLLDELVQTIRLFLEKSNEVSSLMRSS